MLLFLFFPGCTGFNQDATPEDVRVCLQNKSLEKVSYVLDLIFLAVYFTN